MRKFISALVALMIRIWRWFTADPRAEEKRALNALMRLGVFEPQDEPPPTTDTGLHIIHAGDRRRIVMEIPPVPQSFDEWAARANEVLNRTLTAEERADVRAAIEAVFPVASRPLDVHRRKGGIVQYTYQRLDPPRGVNPKLN